MFRRISSVTHQLLAIVPSKVLIEPGPPIPSTHYLQAALTIKTPIAGFVKSFFSRFTA